MTFSKSHLDKTTRFSLGQVEELVLLAIASYPDGAHAAVIKKDLEVVIARELSYIHTILRRSERKGYLKSQLGGILNKRGGRSKRIFTITDFGLTKLQQAHKARKPFYQKVENF